MGQATSHPGHFFEQPGKGQQELIGGVAWAGVIGSGNENCKVEKTGFSRATPTVAG
jgi:hypothetical protein